MEVQASARLLSAMRQDLKFDVDRALFPFESKFVDSRGGARIHYVDEGQGAACSHAPRESDLVVLVPENDRADEWSLPLQVEAGLSELSSKEVLFLWGTEDFAFKQPELKRFMTHFPNHEHHPLHASHFWQDDQGEAVADHIMDWAKCRGWIG